MPSLAKARGFHETQMEPPGLYGCNLDIIVGGILLGKGPGRMQFFTNQDDDNFQLGNFLKTLDVPLLIPGEIVVRIDIIYPSRCSDNCDPGILGTTQYLLGTQNPWKNRRVLITRNMGYTPLYPPKNEGVSHGFPW